MSVKRPYKSVITKRVTLDHIKRYSPDRTNVERAALVFSFIHHLATTENADEVIVKSLKGWEEAFPWLTSRELKETLDKLVELGMLERVTEAGKPSGYIPMFHEDDPEKNPADERLSTQTVSGRQSDGERLGHNNKELLETGLFTEEKVLPQVTQEEREILHYLQENFTKFPHFKFNYEKHLDVIRKYSVEFPTVDILARLKRLEAWELDQKKDTKNWTLAIRNWCVSAVEHGRDLRRLDQQVSTGYDHENAFKGMPEDL